MESCPLPISSQAEETGEAAVAKLPHLQRHCSVTVRYFKSGMGALETGFHGRDSEPSSGQEYGCETGS